MPLQPVAPTETALANQVAQRIVNEITTTAKRIIELRANGIPAVPEQEARTLPDGRIIPARPAQIAVSAEAINAALGADNCALLNQIKTALGL